MPRYWSNGLNLASIPEELKQHRNWVCWDLIQGRKIPMDPVTGAWAKSNDPGTWGSYSESLLALKRFTGLGFMFEKPFVGVDLDGCVEDGVANKYALGIMEGVKSYTELSPSGTGLHIVCRGDLPRAYKKEGLEVYQTRRFFTMTGLQYAGSSNVVEEVDFKALISKEFLSLTTSIPRRVSVAGRRRLSGAKDVVLHEVKGLSKGNIHNLTCRLIGILHSDGWDESRIRELLAPHIKACGGDPGAFEGRLQDITGYDRGSE